MKRAILNVGDRVVMANPILKEDKHLIGREGTVIDVVDDLIVRFDHHNPIEYMEWEKIEIAPARRESMFEDPEV